MAIAQQMARSGLHNTINTRLLGLMHKLVQCSGAPAARLLQVVLILQCLPHPRVRALQLLHHPVHGHCFNKCNVCIAHCPWTLSLLPKGRKTCQWHILRGRAAKDIPES